MKKIAILGSTGSIGKNALNIIENFKDKFTVSFLVANTSVNVIKEQIEKYKVKKAVLLNVEAANHLKKNISEEVKIYSGINELLKLISDSDYDILLSAMVGFAGLKPTLEAIKQGKRIALANKETLVVAGEILTENLIKYKAEIIPVDSEHSAIFQCLQGENASNIKQIILTASGGPFLNRTLESLKNVTIEEALAHPNWKMGKKITIDSATMMNKGLEVIEAKWLFNLPLDKIKVLIHPQSIAHSMVEFIDGSIKAQLGSPDMRLPILYSFSYPERYAFDKVQTDFVKIGNLTFLPPDLKKFECLSLAYQTAKVGGLATCILNAANEIAVEKFLKGKIKFLEIPEIIKYALDKIENKLKPTLEDVFDCDAKTRLLLNRKLNLE